VFQSDKIATGNIAFTKLLSTCAASIHRGSA
jgi:hypothetical protein